jgi:hypothetical protein
MAARHQRRHGGRRLVVHHAGAQAVGDEQNDIVRLRLLGNGRTCQDRECSGDVQQTHRISLHGFTRRH